MAASKDFLLVLHAEKTLLRHDVRFGEVLVNNEGFKLLTEVQTPRHLQSAPNLA